jgi:hypothetical protein
LTRDKVLPQVRKEVRAQALEEGREKGREEERQVHLQTQRKLLLDIVQTHFPTLVKVAKAQVRQIKDIAILDKVLSKVSVARTIEEAEDALLSWLPDDGVEE